MDGSIISFIPAFLKKHGGGAARNAHSTLLEDPAQKSWNSIHSTYVKFDARSSGLFKSTIVGIQILR
jgi:hypothetical protein